MSSSQDPAAIGAEIERLLQRLGALEDSDARMQAQELVRLLISLYGGALSRMLAIVRTERGGPDAMMDRFAEDGLIASLLVLHELHPHPVQRRVEGALAWLAPHLPAGTTVEVLGIHGETLRLRLDAEPAGRAAAAGTIRASIERAIHEAAPEIEAVDIDGLDPAEPRSLIQIVRPPRDARPAVTP